MLKSTTTSGWVLASASETSAWCLFLVGMVQKISRTKSQDGSTTTFVINGGYNPYKWPYRWVTGGYNQKFVRVNALSYSKLPFFVSLHFKHHQNLPTKFQCARLSFAGTDAEPRCTTGIWWPGTRNNEPETTKQPKRHPSYRIQESPKKTWNIFKSDEMILNRLVNLWTKIMKGFFQFVQRVPFYTSFVATASTVMGQVALPGGLAVDPLQCFFCYWCLQLFVNCWFRARWFGFLGSPKMKGIVTWGYLLNPKPPNTQTNNLPYLLMSFIFTPRSLSFKKKMSFCWSPKQLKAQRFLANSKSVRKIMGIYG